MLAGEQYNVLQNCKACNKNYIHTVVCTAIKDNFEQRVYTCNHCSKVTYNSVEHREILQDVIRRHKRGGNNPWE